MFIAVLLYGTGLFSQTYINDLEQSDSLQIWIGFQNRDSSFAHSGKYAAITDSIHPYGLGVEMNFPKEVQNKNVIFSITGFILCDSVYPNSLYVITIENRGEIAFWKGIPLSKLISQKETWVAFSDSVLIPAEVSKTGKLKTYLWNAGRKSQLLIDDLTVSFKPYQNPTFIEDITGLPKYTTPNEGGIVFKNKFYQIKEQGNSGFQIIDNTGNILVNSLRYFFNGTSENKNYHDFSLFRFVKKKKKEESTILTFDARNGLEKIKLTLECSNHSPVIKTSIITKYNKKTEVKRSALVLEYGMPLKEVYRANRKSDSKQFQDEYWLNQQGFLTGNDQSSMALYQTPDISSIQLDTKHQQAIINLDFEKDHPYLQFPLNADTFDYFIDKSTSIYQRKETHSSFFNIYAGMKPVPFPRLMKNPDGFVATYIWTEHADWGDVRTHRATYFGSELITNADSATGGFVKYNIPVTKSVFYDNPDSIRNTLASDSLFTTLESSIITDSNFSSFLADIYNKGSEICLHTPEQYTTTPYRLEEALAYMNAHFNSPTWIDHGYNNQPQNNREDFVCSGVDNYAFNLWKKYDVNYFWSPYYEDSQTFLYWGFFGSMEKFYSGYGDFFPKPDYWQHPTRTKSFYHWPTYSVLYVERESLWNYFFSRQQFNLFTTDWGVEINHCYPAWTIPGKGFWKFDSNGTIVAMDGFNRTLSLMDEYRAKGLLNITTVNKFIDYRLATEQISYDIMPDGRFIITNNSNHTIQGLSFAVKAGAVLVNDLKPAQKRVDNDMIFWFDLHAGEKVLVRVVE